MTRTDDSKASKRQAWKRGKRAEAICVWLLRLKGYRILARAYRTSVGEIDIVARRSKLLIFVEVKNRVALADAAESISSQQRQRITRAAQFYIARFPGLSNLGIRFDAMLTAPRQLPQHVKDAWRSDG